MSFVVYDKNTSLIVKTYTTERGANIGKTAMIKRDAKRASRAATERWNKFVAKDYNVISLAEYDESVRTTKTVRNLMTGKEIVIDINTPPCCDPSTETYWSM
jgi:hypothetical protein